MSELTNENLIKEPIQMARSERHKLIPIIGAGLSVPLGLPSWTQLIDNLLHRLHQIGKISEADFKVLKENSIDRKPIDVLQDIKERPKSTFTSTVQHQLRLTASVTSTTLQALVAASPARIITTTDLQT